MERYSAGYVQLNQNRKSGNYMDSSDIQDSTVRDFVRPPLAGWRNPQGSLSVPFRASFCAFCHMSHDYRLNAGPGCKISG